MHKFKIAIGDWSDDGHGKCEYFQAASEKPIGEVREAYFRALAALPEKSPESFCNTYEDSEVTERVRGLMESAGIDLRDEEMLCPEDMAQYVVWFLNQGDPELRCTLVPDDVPTLHRFGYDGSGRHIGGFGYGLFQ